MNIEKELRIMHACELGAVGVYRGHKCVARYFFRTSIFELDTMGFHESDHAEIFRNLLLDHQARLCFLYPLFFVGGLFYGVIVGFLGLRAIGTSTYAIENIVNDEFYIALKKLKNQDAICKKIREIQLEEQQHLEAGKQLAGDNYFLSRLVQVIARSGAYTAKYMASVL